MPFKPGDPNINRDGRPKGAVSVVEALRRKLKEEIPDGVDKKTYLEALVENIIKKAIDESDVSMMRDIIDRVDGKPKQTIDNITDTSVEEALNIMKNGIKESNEAVQDRQRTSGTDTDPNADIRDDSDKKSQEGNNDSSDPIR